MTCGKDTDVPSGGYQLDMYTYNIERARQRVIAARLSDAEDSGDTTSVYDLNVALARSRRKCSDLLERRG